MTNRSNRIKYSPGEQVFNFVNVVFMLFMIVITLYPMWHVLMAAFSRPALYARHQGLLFWPAGYSLASFEAVFNNPAIWQGFRNTLIIVTCGTGINIVMTSLCAYFLSRRNQTIRNAVMFFVVFTMFFSGGMIPGWLNVQSLGMIDTLWALMIPGAISTFNMIILRTHFQDLPAELDESAKLDGAGEFTILVRIYLPLSSAVIAVLVLFYGVGHWNSWFSAVIYLPRARQFHPLQVVLRTVLIQNEVRDYNTGGSDVEQIAETIKYAVIVVATAPILMLYPFLQKYFVKGVMIGAIKG